MLQYKIKIKKKKKKTYTLEPKKQNPQKKPQSKTKTQNSTVRNIRAKVGQRNCQTPPVLPFPSYLQPASPSHPP